MSSSIAEAINGHHAVLKQSCHAERPQFPEGVRFSYCRWEQSETPYIKVTCSECSIVWTAESPDPNAIKFCIHIGEVPQELYDRLTREQIAKGIRQKPTILQRTTGETPSLVNAF